MLLLRLLLPTRARFSAVLHTSLSLPPLPFSLSRLFTQTKVQEDPAAYVPYGVEAAAAGKEWAGGKLDDTCALVLKFQ